MAASDYVWHAVDKWPAWTLWNVDTTLPGVPSERSLKAGGEPTLTVDDDRTVVV